MKYITEVGYTYTTDSVGRISTVEGKLELGKAKRNIHAQKVAGREDRLITDDGGHLIASIFKGSGGLDNLVPMDSNLNRGAFKTLENAWSKALKQGQEVYVKVRPVFRGDSQRPIRFMIDSTIDGEVFTKVFQNRSGG
ncbi:DNA/RNA non-specific endonuclease [Peribacillus cavernae]|uniref:DNA/RNA non-specific endonuclease n=1 Tax=Peribacillus cavernae TaxID=1674310 RepID=UPI002482982B|nr:DNA/RNA non-specific endonuclease [Peribacillus cavernae]